MKRSGSESCHALELGGLVVAPEGERKPDHRKNTAQLYHDSSSRMGVTCRTSLFVRLYVLEILLESFDVTRKEFFGFCTILVERNKIDFLFVGNKLLRL